MIPSVGFILSYLAGAIPFGYIIARHWGKINILKMGSGNIGATNALRTMGKKAGLSVLTLDLLKGLAAVVVIGPLFYRENGLISQMTYLYALGIAVVCGHVWTIFLLFKGGKGVATALGVLAGLIFFDLRFGLVLFAALCVWIVIVSVWKYVSLGSLGAAVFLPIGLVFFIKSPAALGFGIILAAVITYTHRQNVRRLLTGNEQKINL